jgi:SOS response regulatory protein OraA/RecX
MVTSLHALLQGKQKIIQTLRKKGISQEIIERVIQTDSLENEVENALALAEKVKPNIKDKSVRLTKQKLTQKLMTQGFDFNVIELVMRSLNFTDDEKGELDVLRKAALKAKRKYSSKFRGTGLRNTVFSYLDHQGFNLDDIYIILNEMEWDDE